MKWKAWIILLIIMASLFPVYLINKLLRQKIKPEESMTRLFLYIISGMGLIFIYTFLLVFFIKKLFPEA